jgi:hypothetical protein
MVLRCLLLLALLGCGESQPPSSLKEAINSLNDPHRIPGASSSLDYVFNKLPESGEVDRTWGGHWWPMSEGGTSSTRYGNPSPLKKYDMATGSQANAWEIENAKKYANIGWAGKCNGLASAGIMAEEPQKQVTYKDVTFSVTDIKALLAEVWQGSGYIVGDRCNRSAVTYDQYGRIREDDCRDLNPATLHVAVTNYLGLFGKALIADTDNSAAVWNYPIKAYQILDKKFLTNSEATFQTQRMSSAYIYNSDAVDFVYVKMKITFVTLDPKVYEYILELDVKGKILGGEWLGGSKKDHPDFIWRPLDPVAENPYINIRLVNEIYKNSI